MFKKVTLVDGGFGVKPLTPKLVVLESSLFHTNFIGLKSISFRYFNFITLGLLVIYEML